MNFPRELWANRFVLELVLKYTGVANYLKSKQNMTLDLSVVLGGENPNQSPSLYVYSLRIFQKESIRV